MQDDDFTRKEQKIARKLASKKDRSKFKKSNLKKWEQKLQQETDNKLAKQSDWIRGRVIAILPEEIKVDTETETFCCTLGGVLKKEFSQSKTLIAVGDFVLIEPVSCRIVSICERYSVLSRIDHLHKHKQQILATNVDQVLITLSACAPPLKPSLIDRYLIATFKGNMHPVIVINKVDLLEKGSEDDAYCHHVVQLYKDLGLSVVLVSAHTGEGIDDLKKAMQGKVSVFSGQSGVGKSSLINAMTGLSLVVGDMRKIQKGMHTTTSTRLLPLSFGGWCVDTPGIRSFGIWELTQQDLDHYFPEILVLSQQCHYTDCSHTHEPHCHVRTALQAGELSSLRYESYIKLKKELS